MVPSPANMVADILRKDLNAFIHRSFLELNPQATFHYNWHHDVLADALLDTFRGLNSRMIVNLPPRHLKSHAISVAFPAWVLGHRPSAQILSVTYAQDLSDKLARDSRRLMTSPFYQALFDTRLARGREAVSDFETTQGGYRLSTSVGGVLTGRGADIIIIDDPLKADDALSDARRNAVNEWYDNTLRSRLNNQETGSIIIVMQRLHADDLVTHVQENEEGWQVLAFASIAEEDEEGIVTTPYGYADVDRKEGDVLQPELMSREALEVQRRATTEYNFAAQYQQNPQPPSGLIVKREWLTFYSPEEAPDRFELILQSWDTANKDTELANFSVCTTWGVKHGKAYLLDVFRKKLEFPDLKKTVRTLAVDYKATIVLVEDRASGSSLIQELRAEGFSLVQAAPVLDGDKRMRLRAQTARIEGGFVLFPKKAGWLETYLSELLSFPVSKYDDQVDSTVFALAWIAANPRWIGTLIKPEWLRYYKSLPEDQNVKRIIMAWDTATSDGAQGDWTVCTVWQLIDRKYYLLHVERGIYDYPDLRRTFFTLWQNYRPYQIWIEETAIGLALKNDRDLQPRSIIKLQPIEQNRKNRLYVQQVKFQDGQVLFPEDAAFMAQIENELLNYPHGTTDDIVDSISLALTFGGMGYDSTYSWV